MFWWLKREWHCDCNRCWPVKDVCQKETNLGLIIDNNLKFTSNVNFMLQKVYLKIKLIYTQRHLLTKKIKILICHSLAHSQFNHCDYIYGPCLTVRDVQRIQSMQNAMQNSCVRHVFGIKEIDSVPHSDWGIVA